MKNSKKLVIAAAFIVLAAAVSASAVQRLVLFENQTNTS
jgi:hypothetical protein